MPRTRRSKYFWPASAISPADMALLHAARVSTGLPISQLLAQAVQAVYGQPELVPEDIPSVCQAA